ncbi:MAG: hypothetical protein ABFS86_21060 [Planctomycetota bacterium]
MRLTALCALVLPLLAACGGDAAPEPTGPRYLNLGIERWAELITSNDLEVQQEEMNRLGLGRPDVIPVLTALLDHETPDVVLNAFFCLEANLKKVQRLKRDVSPWVPLIDMAVASAHPRVAELAPELKTTYVGD